MSKKVFIYDGTNQHTRDAWIRVDTPEKENEKVYVSDNFGFHNWHRLKSNENVRGDPLDGKGFSFFFSRYAYEDEFKYRDESFVTNDNPNYSCLLASVPFESIVHLDFIKNDRNLSRILAPKDAVLLSIDIEATGNIIGSYYTMNDEVVKTYIKNKADKLTEAQKNHKLTRWLGEKVESEIISKIYNQLTSGFEQFKKFLLYLKEND